MASGHLRQFHRAREFRPFALTLRSTLSLDQEIAFCRQPNIGIGEHVAGKSLHDAQNLVNPLCGFRRCGTEGGSPWWIEDSRSGFSSRGLGGAARSCGSASTRLGRGWRRRHGEAALVEVPELDAGGVVGAFHAAVELGAPGGST